MPDKLIADLITLAIKEDIGDGDHTSLACIDSNRSGKAQLLVKEKGIIAGIRIAEIVFNRINPSISFNRNMEDGSPVHPGNIAFEIDGNVISILQAERLVLNIMQRMSGIATQVYEYVSRLKGLPTKILDTRKTTPGMRMLDKEAVRLGGAYNHRTGLFDMILIKDNHIDFTGGIENALQKTKEYLHREKRNLPVEIEARSIPDVEKILAIGGVDRILLDNFSVEDTKTAVELIAGRVETESSGEITLKNIRSYAECGVDYISVGAITHQIKSIDLSLKAIDF
jgi:nicotinate-nucleotide pyrophosphorylase (carboxylating)